MKCINCIHLIDKGTYWECWGGIEPFEIPDPFIELSCEDGEEREEDE